MYKRLLIPSLTAVALTLSACGSSSDDSASSAAATASPAATSPGAAGAQSSAGFDASSGSVTINGKEMSFAPNVINAKAGKLKITFKNVGQTTHELVVLKTDTPADGLTVSGGKVSEKDSVGEIAETDPGASGTHTFDLKAGHYVIVCNVPGHYMAGMRGTLVVS